MQKNNNENKKILYCLPRAVLLKPAIGNTNQMKTNMDNFGEPSLLNKYKIQIFKKNVLNLILSQISL